MVFDSQEYWDTVNQMDDLYRNVIDAAACEKMLDGNQVVLKYKDELLASVYLKTKEGNYEHLCDTISYPLLVTETGVYYFQDESFTIWYVDYETMTQQKIWEKDGRKRQEIHLVNYDRDYIYFTAVNQIGHDRENQNVFEPYLMRVPRWSGGEAEKVYRFKACQNGGSLYRNCAVVGERMFFNDYDTILLDPEVNGMGRENSSQRMLTQMQSKNLMRARMTGLSMLKIPRIPSPPFLCSGQIQLVYCRRAVNSTALLSANSLMDLPLTPYSRTVSAACPFR